MIQLILLGMSDDNKSGIECKVEDQAGRRYDAVKRCRDCEAVGRASGRESAAAGRAALGLARI